MTMLASPEAAAPVDAVRTPRSRHSVGALLAGAVLLNALVPLRDIWAARLPLLAALLVVPGLLLLQALRVGARSILRVPVLVPAASLFVLLATSLGVDLIAPPLGVAEPLRTVPLLAGLDIALVVLLAAARFAPSLVADLGDQRVVRVRALWPLLLPLASAVGAERLDNGGGPAVAVAVGVALVVVLLGAGLLAHRLAAVQIGLILYGVSLASILAFTLRSSYQFGYDVMGEYHVMQQTASAGVWHTYHAHDAYGAMLSLTTLPALFHSLAGVAVVEVIKWIYPLVFALFPLVIYGIGRRLLSARAAFLAAAFVTVQMYFFHQMPQIARQEVGMIFFAALAGTLLERSLAPATKIAVVSVLGVGMAVSHYSTTYIAILILALAVVGRAVLVPWHRSRFVEGTTVAALAVIVVASVGWNFSITHSADNVTSFVRNMQEKGFDLLPAAKPGQSLIDSYLKGNREAPESAAAYQAEVAAYYRRDRSYVTLAPNVDDPRYDLVDATAPRRPLRSALVQRGTDFVNLLVQQMSNVVGGLGAVALLVSQLRRRRRRAREPATTRPRALLTSRLDRWIDVDPRLQLAFLATAALAVVIVIRLSGTAAFAYNQERLYLQAMVFLAVPLAYAVERGGRLVRIPVRVVFGGYLALLCVAYATGLGVTYAANGGSPVPSVANTGSEYDSFYLTGPEVAAARWVGQKIPVHGVLYTDEYGQLPIVAFTGLRTGVFSDLTPQTLDAHAWVYATATNVQEGRATGKINGHVAVYEFPNTFLDDQYDTVYSAGTAKVYHR